MPLESDAGTDAGRDDELRKELAACASKLDWRQASRFRFSTAPALKELLGLADGKESVCLFRDLLLRIVGEEEEREKDEEPLYGRSLARAWTVLLRLDEDWEGSYLGPRRQELMGTWRNKRGEVIDSEDGFQRHQEKYIYAELADRLVDAAGQSTLSPRSDSSPRSVSRTRTSAPKRKAPWPVRGHEPQDDQEVVILVAAHAMRTGPGSGLIKLVREFEPYWRATETMLYALEGSYREIWRAGLLHDYEHFAHLRAGFYGGLVRATEVVIAAAESNSKHRAHVVYLIDPHDTSSLYPATAALKRECLLTGTPFLTSERGAARWFRLEWGRRVADGDRRAASELLVSPPKRGFPEDSDLADREEVLALAAHDRHKRAMMEFAERHVDLIDRRFPTRWATQATGHVLNGGSILDEEYREPFPANSNWRRPDQVEALIDAKTSEWALEDRDEGPGSPEWIPQLTRGRRGGVIQLASKVIEDECDTVLFFQDAETPHEHDTEIQVLDRAAQLTDSNCLLLHDERSADRWAENLEACLGTNGTSPATTLVEAFRKVFEVELVLAHTDGEQATGRSRNRQRTKDSKALWSRITAAAAIHIVGTLRTVAAEQAGRGEPLRLGLPWGGATRDILGEVMEGEETGLFDRQALAGALGLQEFVEVHHDRPAALRGSHEAALSKGEWPPLQGPIKPFAPHDLRVVPTVGVIGAHDRSLEAYSLVERAVQVLGGEAVLYPEAAFALAGGRGDPWGGAPSPEWANLDVLLLSAAPLQKRSKKGPAAIATALPSDLATEYGDCVGAVGTIYLREEGNEVREREHKSYRQMGITLKQIQALKARRAEVILVNGVQTPRLRVTRAVLKAGLATTFITDEAFAWGVMKQEFPKLKPPSHGR